MSNYPPPAGGFGAYPAGPPAPPPQPPKKAGSGSTVAIILVSVVGGLVVILGVLAVLAFYGVRKYIANAKQAEARSSIRMMSAEAQAAYEARLDADGDDRDPGRHLCPSASTPVPADVRQIAGMKYQSSPLEWTDDPGFSCLGFAQSGPQYYQYDYESTPAGFTAIARGDLDGDGVLSTFEIEGQLEGSDLVVAPTLKETDPSE